MYSPSQRALSHHRNHFSDHGRIPNHRPPAVELLFPCRMIDARCKAILPLASHSECASHAFIRFPNAVYRDAHLLATEKQAYVHVSSWHRNHSRDIMTGMRGGREALRLRDLDGSVGRSDPLVTCKCRRTPRVYPGRGSTTTVRVCRCHLPPSTHAVRLILVRLTVPFFHHSPTYHSPSVHFHYCRQPVPAKRYAVCYCGTTVIVYYLPRQ
jgi:hypothetical protein